MGRPKKPEPTMADLESKGQLAMFACHACSANPAPVRVTIADCGAAMICEACSDDLGCARSKVAFYSLPHDPRPHQLEGGEE